MATKKIGDAARLPPLLAPYRPGDLAKRLGISRHMLYFMLNSERFPGAELQQKLAEVLSMSTTQIARIVEHDRKLTQKTT